MKDFLVEQYNPSDQEYTITEILESNGTKISKGDIIMSLESSKADMDVEAESSGFFYTSLKVGDVVSVGQVLYSISDTLIDNFQPQRKEPESSRNRDIIISRKAQKLIDLHKISISDLDKTAITEADVVEFIELHKPQNEFSEENLKDFNPKETIVIFGGKGGGKMISDALHNSTQFKNILILDDKVPSGDYIGDSLVIGPFRLYEKLLDFGFNNYVLGFGVLTNREKRLRLYQELKLKGASFPNVIHPRAVIENSVNMGEGNVFLAGCNIGSFVKIGHLNYFNNGCLISHDCEIHDNSHFAPACVLGSSIVVENNCLIGMNSTIYYGIKISSGSVINNGVIVNNSIESKSVIHENR